MVAVNFTHQSRDQAPPIGIVTPFAAQRRLLSKLVKELNLEDWVMVGTIHTFQGAQAELIIFDSVLDEPYWSARLCAPNCFKDVIRDLNVAVTRAKSKFVFVGSSEWLNGHARPASGLGHLWEFLKERADLIPADDHFKRCMAQPMSGVSLTTHGWRLPCPAGSPVHQILDEISFFARFEADMAASSRMIFGLVPFFGEYRWPKIQPLIRAALARGVEVTLVTPPLAEAENKPYVEKAIKNLRDLGAVVISATGLHGKDIVIDERIHYTGSLNWASHRGRTEIMHRTDSQVVAKLVLEYMQAKYIRTAAVHEDGTPRVCPNCGGPTQVVNQRRQHGPWDHQAMKVGCVDYKNKDCGYLRDVNERPPLRDVPLCKVDGRTKYRRARRRNAEIWQCPKHPRECPTEKVIPGDPD